MNKLAKICLSIAIISIINSSFAFGVENEEEEGQPTKHSTTMSRKTDPDVVANVFELNQRLSHVEEQLEMIKKESEATKQRLSVLEEPLIKARKAAEEDAKRRQAIPKIARGYESIYERFLKGVLVYRPTEGSDEGMVVMRIADLANPLESTFDLSKCGDRGQYLSIATGYRKVQTPANANKVEIWFTPRFLVDREMSHLAPNHHMRAIGSWDAARAPIGIFWTWGGWDAAGLMAYCNYLTTESMDVLGSENLLEKHGRATRMWMSPRESARAQGGRGVEHFTFRL